MKKPKTFQACMLFIYIDGCLLDHTDPLEQRSIQKIQEVAFIGERRGVRYCHSSTRLKWRIITKGIKLQSKFD